MKNLIKISMLCFIGTVLMTSCNSNYSITKRHYSSGYYVDNVKSKHTKGTIDENDKPSGSERSASSKVDEDQQLNSTNGKEQELTLENNVLTTKTENSNSKTRSSQVMEEKEMSNSTQTLYPLTHIKSTFSELKKKGSIQKSDEGLSLFWIIILIILILWALGVISAGFAIGSIINLLLLVALILLILWLLRIV